MKRNIAREVIAGLKEVLSYHKSEHKEAVKIHKIDPDAIILKYHYRIYKEGTGYWAKCIELDGALTQADSMDELMHNMHEALNLILDEPIESDIRFPMPDPTLKGKNIVAIEVEPEITEKLIKHHLK
jgi:predicted RNase H-like HicB family nuclease